MTVSLRNTPLLVAQAGTSTTISIASSYNGTTPNANDLLIAVFAIQANATTTLGATPAGWSLSPVNELNASNSQTRVAVYARTATGTSADNAPTWAATATSTAADIGAQVTLYIFSDSSGITPDWGTSGVAQGTSATIAPVTAQTALAGSYAIASDSAYATTAAGATWTTPTAPSTWTVVGTSSTSAHFHYANFSLSAPPAGSTLTCSMAHGTVTTTFQAAFVLVISPPTPFNATRSPSALGAPSDAGPNSGRAGNGARLPARGQVRGIVQAAYQNAPPSYSSQQPAGARVFWLRQGIAQASIVFPVATAPALATFYPLNRPAAAVTRPLPQRGVTRSNPGVSNQAGPAVYPLRGPVAAVTRPLPPRGRTLARPGTFQGTGPQLTPLHGPVTSAVRVLAPRGRTWSRAGTSGQSGPPLTPLQRPVQARQPALLRGRTGPQARAAAPVTPVSAPLYPLHGPVRARIPQAQPGGHAQWRAGTSGQAGPAVTPLQRPVQARQPLPAHGRAQWRYGTFTPVVPVSAPLYPLHSPVAAVVRPQPPRGRTSGNDGTRQQAGVPFPELRKPVAATIRVLPSRGRTAGNPGTAGGSGPAVPPLHRAVQARLGHQPPPKGSVRSNPGIAGTTGPRLTPLQGPVRSAWRYLPPRGTAHGSPGTRGGTGPKLRPAAGPVYSVRSLPGRGRAFTSVRPAPPVPFVQATYYPLRHPVRARSPLPQPGRTYRTLPHVTPAIPPAAFVMTCGAPYGGWRTGELSLAWDAGALTAGWDAGDPGTFWEAGAVTAGWPAGAVSQT